MRQSRGLLGGCLAVTIRRKCSAMSHIRLLVSRVDDAADSVCTTELGALRALTQNREWKLSWQREHGAAVMALAAYASTLAR